MKNYKSFIFYAIFTIFLGVGTTWFLQSQGFNTKDIESEKNISTLMYRDNNLTLKNTIEKKVLIVDIQAFSIINFQVDNGNSFSICHKKISKKKLDEITVTIGKDLINKKNLRKITKDIKSELFYQTHLPILKQGIFSILEYLKTKPIGFKITIWDRVGYVTDSRKRKYKNKLTIKIENKSDSDIKQKIRLLLVNKTNRIEYARQFTLVANAHDTGIFDMSRYFQKFLKKGEMRLICEFPNKNSNIKIKSSIKDKEIFILDLIK